MLTSVDVRRGWDDDVIGSFLRNTANFPNMRAVRLRDADSGMLAAAASLPIWSTLEALHIGSIRDDTFHGPPCSFVPQLDGTRALRTLTIRADDLLKLWDRAAWMSNRTSGT